MNISVETFEIEEVSAALGKAELLDTEQERYHELVESLELAGQKAIFEESDSGEICPYTRLSDATKNQLKAICPHSTPIEQFGAQLIPLRVLEIAALCKEREYFEHLEVWTLDKDLVDPFLIGKISYNVFYLLARWGEELFPMAELRDRALAEIKSAWAEQQTAKIAEVTAFSIEGQALRYVAGESAYTPW